MSRTALVSIAGGILLVLGVWAVGANTQVQEFFGLGHRQATVSPTQTPIDAVTLAGHPGLFYLDAGNLTGTLSTDRFSAYKDLQDEGKIGKGSTIITDQNLPASPASAVGTITGVKTGLGLTGGGTAGAVIVALNPGVGLTFASGQLVATLGNSVDLNSSEVVNVLPVSSGGTGLATLPGAGQILAGTGTGYALTTLAAGDGLTLASAGSSLAYAVDTTVCRTSGNCAGMGGGLVGTGTPNSLAKFIGAGTVGNSQIIDDGTNVGIGTSTPGATLDVNGSLKSLGHVAFGNGVSIDASRVLNIAETFTASTGTLTSTFAYAIADPTANSSASYRGALGLTDAFVNDPSSGINITGSIYGGRFLAQQYGLGVVSSAVGAYGNVSNQNGGTISTAYGVLAENNNATAGGTITTSRAIEARAASFNAGAITTTQGLYVRNPSNAAGGTIGTNYGLYIENMTAGSSNYAIYSAGGQVYLAGNTSLGTTSSTNRLDVNGGVAIGSYAGVIASPSNGLIVSGNVGIGTTNPTSTLTVAGTVSNTGDVNLGTNSLKVTQVAQRIDVAQPYVYLGSGNGAATVRLNANASNVSALYFNGAGGTDTISIQGGVGSTSNLRFFTSGTEQLRIEASGNVGIGGIAPKSKLDVNGGMAIGSYAGVSAAPSNGLIVSGNIGIGTTAPATKLQVAGGSILIDNSTAYQAKDSSGTARSILSYTAANNVQLTNWASSGGIQISNLNDTGPIQFFTGSADTLQMMIAANGNVGIGLASPTAELHVKGNLTTALAGTYGVTNGSATVSTSTDVTASLWAGNAITFAAQVGTVYQISSITTTTITLTANYTGITNAATTAKTDPNLLALDTGAGTNSLTVDSNGRARLNIGYHNGGQAYFDANNGVGSLSLSTKLGSPVFQLYNNGTNGIFSNSGYDVAISMNGSDRFHFTNGGNLGIGVSSGINSKLTFAADTTSAGGISFGGDTNLYRQAAGTLHSDGSLILGSRVNMLNAGDIQTSGGLSIGNVSVVPFSSAVLDVVDSRTYGTSSTGMRILFNANPTVAGLTFTGGTFTARDSGAATSNVNAYVGALGNAQLQSAITATSLIGVQGQTTVSNASGLATNSYSFYAVDPSASGTITNDYGLYIVNKTRGVNNYGIYVAGASTASLWLGSDSATAASGISFGSARDTNLYRSAADTLTTDGLFTAGNGLVIGSGGTTIKKFLSSTVTWDPASVATGAMTSTTITVTGAALGDTVVASFTNAVPAGMVLSGQVTAANTVTVTLLNMTGGAQDLASGTLRADVWQH